MLAGTTRDQEPDTWLPSIVSSGMIAHVSDLARVCALMNFLVAVSGTCRRADSMFDSDLLTKRSFLLGNEFLLALT